MIHIPTVIYPLWELYQELIQKRGISIEQVGNVIDIAANGLPYMESLYEQAKEEGDRLQDKREYLQNNIISLSNEISRLKEEKIRRRRIFASYYYNEE
jgi:hypothetical protein